MECYAWPPKHLVHGAESQRLHTDSIRKANVQRALPLQNTDCGAQSIDHDPAPGTTLA